MSERDTNPEGQSADEEPTAVTPEDTQVEFGDTVPTDDAGSAAADWDQWVVVEQLGAGGMGAVSKVRLQTGQLGALKTMHGHLAQDPGLRTRFLREIRLLERMGGSHFPALLAADPDADIPWMISEYIEAPTLQAVVDASGSLDGDRLVQFAYELLDAIDALHREGVVHRDLKPTNVLMRDGTPVLIDLGVARSDDMSSLTSTGAIIGSPGWMAPEQLTATEEPTTSIDIHGWGALVAYAAQAKPPFGTGTPGEVSQRVLTGNADLSGLPVTVRPSVTAALRSDPRTRPEADELRAALRSRDGGAKAFPPPSDPAHLSDPGRSRRWPRRAAVAIAVIAVGAAGAAWATGSFDGEDPSTKAASEPSTDSSQDDEPTSTTTRPTTTAAPAPLENTDWANRSYQAECGDGPLTVDLVDGQWDLDPTNPGAEKVQLDEVHRYDIDGDGTDEAIVELICNVGAGTVYDQATIFDDVDGSLTVVGPTIYGSEFETDGRYFVVTDPIYGPSDPLCCPSGYENHAYGYASIIPGFQFVASWVGRPAWMDLAEFGSFEPSVSQASAASGAVGD